jgi:hypothetical protein
MSSAQSCPYRDMDVHFGGGDELTMCRDHHQSLNVVELGIYDVPLGFSGN